MITLAMMLTFKFDQFPTIETPRLKLREIVMADMEAVFRLRNEAVSGHYTARPPFESKKEAIELIKKMQDAYNSSSGISWAITLHGEDNMIGSIGFWRIERENYRAEIGYALLPPYHNKGIMTEAIKQVVECGFEKIGIHSIEANLHPANSPSEKVLINAGFVKEGYFKENYFYNGVFDDTLTYGKVKMRNE